MSAPGMEGLRTISAVHLVAIGLATGRPSDFRPMPFGVGENSNTPGVGVRRERLPRDTWSIDPNHQGVLAFVGGRVTRH